MCQRNILRKCISLADTFDKINYKKKIAALNFSFRIVAMKLLLLTTKTILFGNSYHKKDPIRKTNNKNCTKVTHQQTFIIHFHKKFFN